MKMLRLIHSMDALVDAGPDRCVLLVTEGQAASSLMDGLSSCGVASELVSDALIAFAKVMLAGRMEQTRAAWGLRSSSCVGLVVDRARVDDIDDLVEALEQFEADVVLLAFEGDLPSLSATCERDARADSQAQQAARTGADDGDDSAGAPDSPPASQSGIGTQQENEAAAAPHPLRFGGYESGSSRTPSPPTHSPRPTSRTLRLTGNETPSAPDDQHNAPLRSNPTDDPAPGNKPGSKPGNEPENDERTRERTPPDDDAMVEVSRAEIAMLLDDSDDSVGEVVPEAIDDDDEASNDVAGDPERHAGGDA